MRKEIIPDAVDSLEATVPILEALGSVIRQRILLLFEPGEQINIKNVAEQFNLSRTAVVHHINVLQEAGVLKGERVGKEVIMYVDWKMVTSTLGRVVSFIQNEYGVD
jgi:predicted transcriptional regulator